MKCPYQKKYDGTPEKNMPVVFYGRVNAWKTLPSEGNAIV
jgi:hypothetical protein